LGLILELIPKSYTNLGLPPSLETCTRDTFEEGKSFSANSIYKIGKSIASAAGHLHKKGLMHGDLYSHNILINEEDKIYLGDFGAASFYESSKKAYEKIEVRAFGCLLDDLLNLCEDKEGSVYQQLQRLAVSCMDDSPVRRPLFKEMFIG